MSYCNFIEKNSYELNLGAMDYILLLIKETTPLLLKKSLF